MERLGGVSRDERDLCGLVEGVMVRVHYGCAY